MITLLQGDCREVLRGLEAGSVQCVVTSPPYWGLRDYGLPPLVWDGDAGCSHEWGVERTIHTGNAPSDKTTLTGGKGIRESDAPNASQGQFCRHCSAWRGTLGLEPTPDLYMVHMVEVFREVKRVLRDDGTLWLNLGDSYAANRPAGQPAPTNTGNRAGYLSSGVQGAVTVPPGLKPKDLCGIPWRVALALQADGWYLRSDIIWHKPNCMPESVTDRPTTAHEHIFLLARAARYYWDQEAVREPAEYGRRSAFRSENYTNDRARVNYATVKGGTVAGADPSAGRNIRTVWTIPTYPYPGAHFATFPPALVEPCIKAGCPEGRTVLDLFGGSGTVGLVADRLGRDAVLIELNPSYVEMAEDRIRGDAPLLVELETVNASLP